MENINERQAFLENRKKDASCHYTPLKYKQPILLI